MKVTLVLDSLGAGGAERSTAVLLPALINRGVHPELALLRHEAKGSEQEVRDLGVPVHILEGGSLIAKTRSLRHLISKHRPDIVHTAVYTADQVGRIASIALDTRVVSSLVSMPRLRRFRTAGDPPAWKVDLVNAFDVVTGTLCVDRFHAVTPGVADMFVQAYRIRPSRITVVERGRHVPLPLADEQRSFLRSSLGIAPENQLLLAAGRHEHQKAHVDLVRAVALLAHEGRAVRLAIAGREGNATSDLLRAIEQTQGASAAVQLLGHRVDVPELLAAADVMCLPSILEGTAGIALEAMAAGTPIVSTRLEGMAGILEHERNSLIVEPRDPHAMATAVARILDDPSLAARLASAGRSDFLDRFTLERSADRMVEMYRSVLSDR